MKTTLNTTDQKKIFTKRIEYCGEKNCLFTVTLKYGDSCKNGHNTFSITGEITKGSTWFACGCLHDEIKKHFPELAYLIKWHLCSTDGPMHYIANTVYHVKNNNLSYARSSTIWDEVTEEELRSENIIEKLNARLPKLLEDFNGVITNLGFIY